MAPAAPSGMAGHVTPAALLAAIDAGRAPAILDVRSEREFAAGHVPGATHIPFQSVPRRVADVLATAGDPLVIYCGHGPRAWMAAAVLRRHGFRRISYLTGHMAGWRRARLREETA